MSRQRICTFYPPPCESRKTDIVSLETSLSQAVSGTQVTFKEGAVPTFSGRPGRFHRKLNNNHLPTKFLLSNLFVRPRHSLADPPPAAWMDAGGQYADPACPLAAHAANNRGPCVFSADCITGPLTSGGHWPESANAITQRKPPNAAGSAGGRGEVGGRGGGAGWMDWMWQFPGLLSYHCRTGPKLHSLHAGRGEISKSASERRAPTNTGEKTAGWGIALKAISAERETYWY